MPAGLTFAMTKRTELRPIRCRRADWVNRISTRPFCQTQLVMSNITQDRRGARVPEAVDAELAAGEGDLAVVVGAHRWWTASWSRAARAASAPPGPTAPS